MEKFTTTTDTGDPTHSRGHEREHDDPTYSTCMYVSNEDRYRAKRLLFASDKSCFHQTKLCDKFFIHHIAPPALPVAYCTRSTMLNGLLRMKTLNLHVRPRVRG